MLQYIPRSTLVQIEKEVNQVVVVVFVTAMSAAAAAAAAKDDVFTTNITPICVTILAFLPLLMELPLLIVARSIPDFNQRFKPEIY